MNACAVVSRDTPQFRRAKGRVLALCVAGYTVSYLCRTNLSLALADMAAVVGATRSAMGAWSTGYFWLYAVGQLICGWLCTRHNPKYVLSAGLLLTAACNFAVSFAHTYWSILLLWTANGFALALFWPSIVHLTAQWIDQSDYMRVSILLNLPTTVGYFLGWGLLGTVRALTSWQYVFRVPAILALVFLFFWCRAMPDSPQAAGFAPPPPAMHPVRKQQQGTRGELARILCTGTMLSFALIIFVHGATKESINLWALSLLADVAQGKSDLLVSAFASLVPLFSTCGLLLTGWSLRRSSGGLNRILFVLVLGGAACAWALFFYHSSVWPVLLFLGLLLGMLYGAATLLTTLVPLRFAYTGRVAQISGIFNFLAYLGAALGGTLSGWTYDHWGWVGVYLLWAMLNTAALAGQFLAEWWRSR